MADDAIVALFDTSPPTWEAAVVVARQAEWQSDSALVTVWRGPEKPDEHLPRMRLRDAQCETLLVTEFGYWDCVILEELVEPAVTSAIEEILQDQADLDLAMIWSWPESEEQDFGDEVFVTATFGEHTGVNGDIVTNPEKMKPPDGWILTERGGHIPSEEAEISKEPLYEYVLDAVSKELGRPVPEEMVDAIIDREYPKDYIYWSGSGHSEVWVSPQAMKEFEEENERRRQKRAKMTDEQRRQAREAREREEEARRQAIRDDIAKGKYGSKQDWSPRGRIPGVSED